MIIIFLIFTVYVVIGFSEFIHLIIHLSLKHYGKVKQFHIVFSYYYWT